MQITAGRIVNYVLANGQVRPLIVTRVRGDELGHVSGVLFFDGSNDAEALPRPAENPAAIPVMDLAAVRHDETKNANTWHWPERVN